MYKGKRIAVVIPAYNEEGFVGNVIQTVPPYVDRIYPVDDCSRDRTWTEIRATAAMVNARSESPPTESVEPVTDGGEPARVVPIRHDTNRGVGAAIKTGYRRAVEDGADVIAVMNGDGQMDPDILDRILDPVVDGEAGYSKGNRLSTSEHVEGMSGWRLFGNVLLTGLTRIASGYWHMVDPQNGYTAVSVETLEKLDLDELYDQYGFLNHLLVRLNVQNVTIADVEMSAVYGDETSSIQYHRFIPTLSWLLLRTFLWRLQQQYVDGDRQSTVPYVLGLVGAATAPVLVLFGAATLEVSPALSGGLILFVCLLLIGLGMALERRQSGHLGLTVRH